MAGTNRRREEPEDPGYEVVEDPGYEVVENPPRPTRAKPVAAKPLAAKPVVPPPKKPKVSVVEDEEDDRPRKRTRPRDEEDEDDEDERPRKKSAKARVADDDEDEDDRPRKKKRKKGKGGVVIDDETNNVLLEWGPAVFMILVGVIMLAVGTWGQAKQPAAQIANPVIAVMLMIGLQFVTIPLTIVALVMIGSVFGIEYGTILSTVRNLAALSFLINGMIALFQWAGLAFFIYEPVVLLVGIGLFMTLFKLDIWETLVTMFALNVMSWVLNLVALLIIFAMLSKAARDRDREDDFDSLPKFKQGKGADDNRPWRKGNPDPDDDPFDPDDR